MLKVHIQDVTILLMRLQGKNNLESTEIKYLPQTISLVKMYASKILIIIYSSDNETVRYSIMVTGQSLPYEF